MKVSADKVAVMIMSICLSIGASTHILDNINFGFLPYRFAPQWMNFYWTSLGLLDLFAVLLLIKYRKAGVLLTFLIMISDVYVNSLAYYSLNIIIDPIALQLQTLFLGFCVGSSLWLWNRSESV
ncbi:hypothetical protein V6260_01300 [Pseudoalteromonas aliena]|uniref:hypothetical protein n=1 Tax=Pseudoalteromonas aliena TaxID=247523 RepID=UPI00311F5368